MAKSITISDKVNAPIRLTLSTTVIGIRPVMAGRIERASEERATVLNRSKRSQKIRLAMKERLLTLPLLS
jgi:hypothetical protein